MTQKLTHSIRNTLKISSPTLDVINKLTTVVPSVYYNNAYNE
ncbi:Uncharacterised protein [Alysiella crassa]|uniref:Uncharacterized protein n=1 Tax=Alysiella crassa TaxID=153491 RepID=A0A376BXT2_9NEIS|nr:Uncharacterised protein [Alysiella crassa]